ncbi:MAG: hypothetical protein ABSD85_13505 [Acidimicrobiales bacterium]
MSGASGPIRQSPRHSPPSRYPPEVYFRRRLAVILTVALFIALIVGLVTLTSGGNSAKRGTTTTTRPHTTTTATTPTAGPSGIGVKTVTWTDTNSSAAQVVSPAVGGHSSPRTFVTEIWYPSTHKSKAGPVAGAKPDYRDGPYPVVVFAHGFDTLPSTYTPLLSAWVKAGFVVAAPRFPDENADEISSLGNATTSQLEIAESDVINEPYDIADVVSEVESGATGAPSSGAAWLKGLVEPGKYALAGHSDGAQAVAALVYAQASGQEYATTYGDLATHPFAVIILSGSELSGSYAPPASPPALLFVQSAVDECNVPEDAGTLFHAAGGGIFLKLLEASHFGPYIGKGRAAGIVENVTAAFLKAALSGTPSASALLSLLTPADVAVLYPPSTPPVLATLSPGPTERQAACSAR